MRDCGEEKGQNEGIRRGKGEGEGRGKERKWGREGVRAGEVQERRITTCVLIPVELHLIATAPQSPDVTSLLAPSVSPLTPPFSALSSPRRTRRRRR